LPTPNTGIEYVGKILDDFDDSIASRQGTMA
jgi:hypothetical protein